MSEIKGLDALVKHTEEAMDKQRKTLVIDLDEAVKEFKEENPDIEIRVLGKSFFAPGSISTDIYVKYLRFHQESSKLTNEQMSAKVFELLDVFLGDEMVQHSIDNRIPLKVLVDNVLTPIMSHYYGDATEQAPKNKKAPIS